MPRIFKGSESELRLLLSRSQETLTDIKIKLYTTNLEDAIEVIDGIAVEGDTAVISLAPRAFIGMEDGVVNYIVEAKVEGQSYYMERQSNYMLRSLSYINESGVASTTLEITQNGDYRVTPNDGLYVDIDVNVPLPVILPKDSITVQSGEERIYEPHGYDGVKTLTVRGVSSEKDKMHIPNGVIFSGSTIEEFPFDDYNWEWYHYADGMFKECPNLKNIGYLLSKMDSKELDLWGGSNIFAGNSIEVIENIDFSKFGNACKKMFTDTKDLKEVRNCVFPLLTTSSTYTEHYFIYRAKNSDTRFKVVDCDFSKAPKSSNLKSMLYQDGSGVYPYFINFKYPAYSNNFLIEWSSSAKTYDCIAVTECEYVPPSSATTTDFKGSYEVWYKPELTTWKGVNCKPWGFYFNVLNKQEQVKSIYCTPLDERIKEIQVLNPVGNGRYEDLYPLFQKRQVNIELTDGTIHSPEVLQNIENIDIYIPDTELKSSYEGSEIINAVYWGLNSGWTATETGIYAVGNDNNVSTSRFNIATKGKILAKVTFDVHQARTYNVDFKIYANGTQVSAVSVKPNDTKTITIELSGDYIGLSFRLDTYADWNMEITKIEYL